MAERVWRQGKRADTPVKVGEVDENVFRMLIWFQEAVRSSFDACEAAVKVQIPAHVSSARVELERLGSGDLSEDGIWSSPGCLTWSGGPPDQISQPGELQMSSTGGRPAQRQKDRRMIR